MNKVYLSGAMMGCSHSEIFGWREEAKRLLGRDNCICPADRWHPDEHELLPAECAALVQRDLLEIDWSGGLLVNAWKCGWGTAMEVFYAHQKRKLVATVANGPVSPWLRVHSDKLASSVSEAARWLAANLNLREAPCLR